MEFDCSFVDVDVYFVLVLSMKVVLLFLAYDWHQGGPKIPVLFVWHDGDER